MANNPTQFDRQTLLANRAGRLTRSQTMRVIGGHILWELIEAGIGVFFITVGLLSQQSDGNIALLVIALLVGAGLLWRGISGIYAGVQDSRSGVDSIAGIVSVSTKSVSRTSDRGTSTGGKRFYLHVQNREGERLTFPIDRTLYTALLPESGQRSYTVYYLPKMKTLLSFE